jgi:type I restriction enzyme S subunit
MSTATLLSEKEKTLIPKLRFEEFHGEWKNEKLIKHVHSISSGKIKPSNEGEFLVYGSTGIIGKSNIYTHEGDYILVARVGANAGQINRAKGKYAVTDNTLIIDLKENISVSFCESFLTKFNLNKLIFGSGQPLITGSLLKAIDFIFPTLAEQQKIASFLSAVDEKIQQLSRQKELLEHYKKGVMQQLFTGKLRFKPARPAGGDENGNDYVDWEEKKLGDIARIAMGQSPDSKSYNTDSKGILLIQGNADIKDRITIPRQWTSEPTKTCEIGDLILTVRAPVGSIAKSLHNACIGRGVCSITNNKNSIQEYLYQFFLSYESKWIGLEQGSTFTAVSGSDIKGLKLNLPSLPEQQKIATFLSSIDTKIESTSQQINQTQSFKKGLLQQMFV